VIWRGSAIGRCLAVGRSTTIESRPRQPARIEYRTEPRVRHQLVRVLRHRREYLPVKIRETTPTGDGMGRYGTCVYLNNRNFPLITVRTR
jgi:hypothetical protein